MKRIHPRKDEPQNPEMQKPETQKGKMRLSFVIPLLLFYLVVGVLLIWFTGTVTTIASYILSALLIIGGAWLVLRYIRSETEARIAGKDLALGLILLLAGVLLVFSPNDLELVFPKLWGLSLVFGGFLKIQYAFDEKTVKVNRWWIMLIFAAVSLIIGILALLSKSFFGESQYLIIGIFMLGEAILDIVTYFLIANGMKKYTADKELARLEEAYTAAKAAALSSGSAAGEPASDEKAQEE